MKFKICMLLKSKQNCLEVGRTWFKELVSMEKCICGRDWEEHSKEYVESHLEDYLEDKLMTYVKEKKCRMLSMNILHQLI